MKHRGFLMLLLISIAFLGVAGPGKLSPLVVDDPPQYSDWSAPVNLGTPPNSGNLEAGAFISKNGLSLFFGAYGRTDGYGGFDLYVSQRASLTAPWGEPQNLGPNINTSSNEQTPALSLDEHILYFTSDRLGGVGGSDIYGSRRHNRKDDLAWQESVNLGSGVNSTENENGPALFEDDETGVIHLYFGSNRLGGPGGIDIYASTLQPDETFGPAEIVYELNTPYNDQRPSIRRDGLEIFFDSTRPVGAIGMTDLWVSTRLSTSDPWSIPVNLGPLVNSKVLDARPSLSFDGTALYFHSGPSTNYDLYVSTRTRFHRKYENSGNAGLRFKVELRPGVVSYVEAIYMANLNRPSGGKTLLAIPGMGLSANSYRPLVEQLFAVEDQSHSKVFSRAVLVDYPGHGGSSLPENSSSADPLLFGNMTLEDYVATMLGVMDQLEFLQISPDTLLGHSMGGIILGMVQKQLLAQGTDLLRQYGIKDVIMIAPAPPAQVQGWRADPVNIDLTPWTVSNDPTMGTYIKFSAKFTLNNCFKNLSGVTVPGAAVEYLADPILSANESMKVVQEIFGKPPFSKRPMVDSGVFDWRHGTSLSVIGFSQDAIYTPEGQRGIYKYLTGDPSGGLFSGHRYFFIDSPDAVHAMYYSNPAALISVGNTFH